MNESQPLKAQYSQRFARAMSMAEDFNYYSLDGKTWDKSADWNVDANHIFAYEEFKAQIFDEIYRIMDLEDAKVPTLEQLPEELRNWLLRVEEQY